MSLNAVCGAVVGAVAMLGAGAAMLFGRDQNSDTLKVLNEERLKKVSSNSLLLTKTLTFLFLYPSGTLLITPRDPLPSQNSTSTITMSAVM